MPRKKKEKQLLNCRFVATSELPRYLTRGKIYTITDGRFTNDIGEIHPIGVEPFTEFMQFWYYMMDYNWPHYHTHVEVMEVFE